MIHRPYECGVCWSVYSPLEGDPLQGVPPGVAFEELPEGWTCPHCDHPPTQFLIREPGPLEQGLHESVSELVRAFQRVLPRMKDVPIINPRLQVEAVGWRGIDLEFLGIVITPWFLSLIRLPIAPGQSLPRRLLLPAGEFEFEAALVEGIPYWSCSLFSPVLEFVDQAAAVETARACLKELFRVDPPTHTNRRHLMGLV